MFGNLFSKKSKRKPLKVKEEYFGNSILGRDKEIALKLVDAIDSFICDLEEFANGKNCSLQKKLKDEKQMDMVRAEMLVLCFRYFDHSAGQAKFNPEIGPIIYSSILDYIDSLSIQFPTDDFKDSQDFFESRLTDYSQFFTFYFSKDDTDIQDSLKWLLSVISIRPLKLLQSNELSEHRIYPPDFSFDNMMMFPAFFTEKFNPTLDRIDKCFK
jgi:hypothetical protein